MNHLINTCKKILISLSLRVLHKHKPFVIAVIGSVGKTAARNTIYTVLSKKHSVRKSEQHLASDIAVPLTILGCPYDITHIKGIIGNIKAAGYQFFASDYPQYLIVEIDGYKRGEVARLADWLPIDLLVVTPIGEVPDHVEYFKTPDVLRQEYACIQNAVKEKGKIVFCADDEYSREIAGTRNPTISYGMLSRADIRATEYDVVYENNVPIGVSFAFERPHSDERLLVRDTLGVYAVNAILAAMAVLQALGEHPFSLNNVFEKMTILPGRMRLLKGLKGSMIIDDSYTSSPVAVEDLISVLSKVDAKRKILVLGDMLELGRFSAYAHREVGRQCLGVDMLVCVGLRARFIKEGALEAGMKDGAVLHYDTPETAGEYIQNILTQGDLVAIKGSRHVRMERCVEEIMAEPEKKEKLLVRQGESEFTHKI